MSVSDNLVHMYNSVKEQPVDEQIVMLCSTGCNFSISPSIILAQYKFCLNHGIHGDEFQILKQYLVMLSSEDDVQKLEVL